MDWRWAAECVQWAERGHIVSPRAQLVIVTADLFPGGTGWPKFNQLEMVTTFTYKPSVVKIDARNFELL